MLPLSLQSAWDRYQHATQQPLYCLLFLFPIVAAYEFGALILKATPGPHDNLVAQNLINSFLAIFGAQGGWLPGAALILTLLIWHLLTRQPWHIHGWVLPLMLVESVVLAAPLLVLTQLSFQAGGGAADPMWHHRIVLAIGAGIYEELVFRLYLVTGVMLLLTELLGLKRGPAEIAAIIIPSLLFSICHVRPVGVESFRASVFLIRALAGVYLSYAYLHRGLGVAVGCHAAHNVLQILMRGPLI